MYKYLIVALGGAVGSMLRFWGAGYVSGRLGTRFPYGTFVINITASFLIGFIMTVLSERTHLSPSWRYLLVVGFLGGYSTFSSFEYETFSVFRVAVWIGAITGRTIA
jgi:fluoride exporter